MVLQRRRRRRPQEGWQGPSGDSSGVLDWRSASAWSQMAALLDVGCGFEGQDPVLLAWLAERLAKRGAGGNRAAAR